MKKVSNNVPVVVLAPFATFFVFDVSIRGQKHSLFPKLLRRFSLDQAVYQAQELLPFSWQATSRDQLLLLGYEFRLPFSSGVIPFYIIVHFRISCILFSCLKLLILIPQNYFQHCLESLTRLVELETFWSLCISSLDMYS